MSTVGGRIHHSDGVDLPKDVQIQPSHNVSYPGSVEKSSAATKNLCKKVLLFLDKLASQVFCSYEVIQQNIGLQITTEEQIKCVIGIIFEKALNAPKFSKACAKLCKLLVNIEVPQDGVKSRNVVFKVLLLDLCQKEFEKEMNRKEIDKPLEEKTGKSKESNDLAEDATKHRSSCNIRLDTEDTLENLCHLLTIVGKDIDTEESKPRIDQYFIQLKKIVRQKRHSAGVRLLIEDVIKRRENNWQEAVPGFVCDECGVGFASGIQLAHHLMETHDRTLTSNLTTSDDIPPPTYKHDKCIVCGDTFQEKKEMFKHRGRCHPRLDLSCPECGIMYDLADSMQQHLKGKHGIRCQICIYCGEQFDSARKCVKHMHQEHSQVENNTEEQRNHSRHDKRQRANKNPSQNPLGQGMLTCPECGLTYSQAQSIHQHMRDKHHILHYFCSYCTTSCHFPADLLLHMETMHPGYSDRTMNCQTHYLGDSYSVSTSSVSTVSNNTAPYDVFDEEAENHLSFLQPDLVFQPGEEMFLSADDNNGSRSPDHLHYKCVLCNDTFLEANEVKQHTAETHDIPSFPCVHCYTVYKTYRALCDHTKDKHCIVLNDELICEECGSQFDRQDSFLNHICMKHKLTIHLCQYCDEIFEAKHSLTEHTDKVHSKTTDSPCSDCKSVFKLQESLNQHRRVKHQLSSDSEKMKILSTAAAVSDTLSQSTVNPLGNIITTNKQYIDVRSSTSLSAVTPNVQRETRKSIVTQSPTKTGKDKTPSGNLASSELMPTPIITSEKLNTITPLFLCPLCFEVCLSLGLLSEHTRDVHGLPPGFLSSICGIVLPGKSDEFLCAQCMAKYTSMKCLQEHVMRNHATFSMCHCGECFLTELELTTHEETIHSCSSLSIFAPSVNNLHSSCVDIKADSKLEMIRDYKDTQSSSISTISNSDLNDVKHVFHCNICSKHFKEKHSMLQHVNSSHPDEIDLSPQTCDICQRTFKDILAKEQHLLTKLHQAKVNKANQSVLTKSPKIELSEITANNSSFGDACSLEYENDGTFKISAGYFYESDLTSMEDVTAQLSQKLTAPATNKVSTMGNVCKPSLEKRNGIMEYLTPDLHETKVGEVMNRVQTASPTMINYACVCKVKPITNQPMKTVSPTEDANTANHTRSAKKKRDGSKHNTKKHPAQTSKTILLNVSEESILPLKIVSKKISCLLRDCDWIFTSIPEAAAHLEAEHDFYDSKVKYLCPYHDCTKKCKGGEGIRMHFASKHQAMPVVEHISQLASDEYDGESNNIFTLLKSQLSTTDHLQQAENNNSTTTGECGIEEDKRNGRQGNLYSMYEPVFKSNLSDYLKKTLHHLASDPSVKFQSTDIGDLGVLCIDLHKTYDLSDMTKSSEKYLTTILQEIFQAINTWPVPNVMGKRFHLTELTKMSNCVNFLLTEISPGKDAAVPGVFVNVYPGIRVRQQRSSSMDDMD